MKLHPMWQDYPDLAQAVNHDPQLMEDVVKLKNKKSRIGCVGYDPCWWQAFFAPLLTSCCLLNLVQNKMKESHLFSGFHRNAPYGHPDS